MSPTGVSVFWEARRVDSVDARSESIPIVDGEPSSRQPENVVELGVSG